MTSLLLLIPLALSVYVFASEPVSEAPPPEPAAKVESMAPVDDTGRVAYATAKEHLAGGRLGSATYFFEQAARNNYAAPEAYHAMALIQYRLDNVEQGDRLRDLSGSEGGGEWRDKAAAARQAAADRIKAREAAAELQSAARWQFEAVPPPASKARVPEAKVPETKVAEAAESPGDSPGTAMGVRGCKVLVSVSDGQGVSAARLVTRLGGEVDCLANDSTPPPSVTTIWYSDSSAETALQIAAGLHGARMIHATDLPNGLEIRFAK